MIKVSPLILTFLSAVLTVNAQTPVPSVQPFGKIDKADLEMKACEFEPDANAMVLFDKGDVYYDQDFNVSMERHKRIKIFNDNGKKQANVRIEFAGGDRSEYITGLEAETINLTDGKVEITKLDKKVLYTENVDKVQSAYVFTFPNVKSGSVVEFKYRWTTVDYSNVPDWFFQNAIPVRYSELDTEIPDLLYFKTKTRITRPFVKNTSSTESKSIGSGTVAFQYSVEKEQRAMANLHSMPDEPFMTSLADNLECILFNLNSIRPTSGFTRTFADTWVKIGLSKIDDDSFGGQFKRKLSNEEVIIAKAKAFKTNDEKIDYVFNEVRNNMKWDGVDRRYTNDGTVKAWEKKVGNSTDINLILYRLLKQSGLNVYPMLVSTREHGKVNPAYPFLYQFNRTVVYMPIDSAHNYVMDATGKYNLFNETPYNLLNSSGLYIDKENKTADLVFLQKESPVRHMALINAEIKPEGKMEGTAQLSSFSYDRINSVRLYKTDGEEKYIEHMRDNDNSMKISAIKFDNMEIDTLPLTQTISFKQELTGSDGTYIYFNPNLFTTLHSNPFLNEKRFSDIDFGYRNYFSINGIYKTPAGYKTESLPKSITLVMPDKSISFRRIVAEQEGSIIVRFTIDYKKSIYFKEDYADLREFYKKMQEMLNEAIVLKKS